MEQSQARRYRVFYSPYNGQRLVKRVIGLPGDTLELRNEVLILNGRPIQYIPITEELLRDLSPEDRASHVFATERLPGKIIQWRLCRK
jgi:signal peptidase I